MNLFSMMSLFLCLLDRSVVMSQLIASCHPEVVSVTLHITIFSHTVCRCLDVLMLLDTLSRCFALNIKQSSQCLDKPLNVNGCEGKEAGEGMAGLISIFVLGEWWGIISFETAAPLLRLIMKGAIFSFSLAAASSAWLKQGEDSPGGFGARWTTGWMTVWMTGCLSWLVGWWTDWMNGCVKDEITATHSCVLLRTATLPNKEFQVRSLSINHHNLI